MTGAYLFSKRKGKRVPLEVEFLTDEERNETFKDRKPEELISWINMLCKNIVDVDEFLKSEGYERKENPDGK